eukprot:TRINITY_DN30489_c0_g1_i1.p1 TRINITY_DN30489_c0_g1~~TRINITY_DN30489_c0_g1_i1.p1  ORF type:complete len:246 (+),score=15.28 TRINITY_DN30489_c0_g1_i1:305-1042(+)
MAVLSSRLRGHYVAFTIRQLGVRRVGCGTCFAMVSSAMPRKTAQTTQTRRALVLGAAAAAAIWCTRRDSAFATLQLRTYMTVDERTGLRQGSSTSEIIMMDGLPTGAVLQLADGVPNLGGTKVGHGPPWATCFANVEVSSMRHDGKMSSSHVLEQWVMPAERQSTDTFKVWRSNMAEGPVNIRCSPTVLNNVDDIVCLECASASSEPLTPDQRKVSSASLVPDLQQCMKRSFDGTGFCKSASLVM